MVLCARAKTETTAPLGSEHGSGELRCPSAYCSGRAPAGGPSELEPESRALRSFGNDDELASPG